MMLRKKNISSSFKEIATELKSHHQIAFERGNKKYNIKWAWSLRHGNIDLHNFSLCSSESHKSILSVTVVRQSQRSMRGKKWKTYQYLTTATANWGAYVTACVHCPISLRVFLQFAWDIMKAKNIRDDMMMIRLMALYIFMFTIKSRRRTKAYWKISLSLATMNKR